MENGSKKKIISVQWGCSGRCIWPLSALLFPSTWPFVSRFSHTLPTVPGSVLPSPLLDVCLIPSIQHSDGMGCAVLLWGSRAQLRPSGPGVWGGGQGFAYEIKERRCRFPFICLRTAPLQPLCCIQRASSASTNYLAKVFLGEIISHKHLLSSLLYVPRGSGALDINHLVPSPSTHLSQRTP